MTPVFDVDPDGRLTRRLPRRSLLAWVAAASATGVHAAPARAPQVLTPTSSGEPLLAPGGNWRATYLDFWASWCGPCRQSFPWMNAMAARHGEAGLRIVGINLDRREADAQRFLRDVPARFALLMDPKGELARLFDVAAMPTSLLVGPDLDIVFTHRGFREGDGEALERRIEALLRGRG